MQNRCPNMDAMHGDELTVFAKHHLAGRNYAELYPYCSEEERKVAREVTGILARFANNKRRAQQARLEGRIEIAQRYESLCEWFYNQIPQAYRW